MSDTAHQCAGCGSVYFTDECPACELATLRASLATAEARAACPHTFALFEGESGGVFACTKCEQVESDAQREAGNAKLRELTEARQARGAADARADAAEQARAQAEGDAGALREALLHYWPRCECCDKPATIQHRREGGWYRCPAPECTPLPNRAHWWIALEHVEALALPAGRGAADRISALHRRAQEADSLRAQVQRNREGHEREMARVRRDHAWFVRRLVKRLRDIGDACIAAGVDTATYRDGDKPWFDLDAGEPSGLHCGNGSPEVLVRRLVKALAAADALVGALPKCRCGDVATWSMPNAPDMETGHREDAEMVCDQHVHHQGCGRVGCCDPTELPWAGPVRAYGRTSISGHALADAQDSARRKQS